MRTPLRPAAAGMHDFAEFERRVAAVVTRFHAQNAAPAPSAAELAQFVARFRQLVARRGLPPPLHTGDTGLPGGLPEAECAALVAEVVGAESPPLLAEAARQLVKACFYPEFATCRDSFREVSRDGGCRRQELARVRRRISGTHCVDCPHWVALEPGPHAAFLRDEWHGDRDEFDAHRDIFLPEDFRALRRWLHVAARR